MFRKLAQKVISGAKGMSGYSEGFDGGVYPETIGETVNVSSKSEAKASVAGLSVFNKPAKIRAIATEGLDGGLVFVVKTGRKA